MDFSLFADPQAWIGLLTLTLLEIVLGIDNIVFISIISGKVEQKDQKKTRQLGLGLAVITRILFLLSIGLIMRLSKPFFEVAGHGFSGRDLILLVGGTFLIAKATIEIHEKLEGAEREGGPVHHKGGTVASVVVQILLLDLVFSIDSVITAVGMVKYVEIMIAAVIVSVAIMMLFVNRFAEFIEKRPTIKILALSFLVLIGVNLVAEGLGQSIPKGYTYFAMAFSLLVETLNIRLRHVHEAPVHLKRNLPE